MKPDELTEIVYVRMSSDTRDALKAIAERSVSRRLSDHIRAAVEEYIARHVEAEHEHRVSADSAQRSQAAYIASHGEAEQQQAIQQG